MYDMDTHGVYSKLIQSVRLSWFSSPFPKFATLHAPTKAFGPETSPGQLCAKHSTLIQPMDTHTNMCPAPLARKADGVAGGHGAGPWRILQHSQHCGYSTWQKQLRLKNKEQTARPPCQRTGIFYELNNAMDTLVGAGQKSFLQSTCLRATCSHQPSWPELKGNLVSEPEPELSRETINRRVRIYFLTPAMFCKFSPPSEI